ncbi:hypothetical protein AVEN_187484-1 [Araneus ventricosus]|uniref:Uncharacterized protein n=1 Tax=Araneus ventricosus TaxID=182803 RepID=A0A4Y2BRX6_ARAVE|nr:hypothetical protein AVEN_187484-1 [Araneus ventricosus]
MGEKAGGRAVIKETLKGEMKGLPFISPITRREEKMGNEADESIPQINDIFLLHLPPSSTIRHEAIRTSCFPRQVEVSQHPIIQVHIKIVRRNVATCYASEIVARETERSV